MSAGDMQIGGDHYVEMGVEPWDVIDTWPLEQQIGFYRGNALKYLMRMGRKDANAQEAQKAAHYQQKLIEVLDHANRAEQESSGSQATRHRSHYYPHPS